jgi:hypothetical protein
VAVVSFLAAVLTEVYLCGACSCQEMLRRNGADRGAKALFDCLDEKLEPMTCAVAVLLFFGTESPGHACPPLLPCTVHLFVLLVCFAKQVSTYAG